MYVLLTQMAFMFTGCY